MDIKEIKKKEKRKLLVSLFERDKPYVVILGFSIVLPTIGGEFEAGLSICVLELVLYYCFVWIYRGFKEPKEENTDKNNN